MSIGYQSSEKMPLPVFGVTLQKDFDRKTFIKQRGSISLPVQYILSLKQLQSNQHSINLVWRSHQGSDGLKYCYSSSFVVYQKENMLKIVKFRLLEQTTAISIQYLVSANSLKI